MNETYCLTTLVVCNWCNGLGRAEYSDDDPGETYWADCDDCGGTGRRERLTTFRGENALSHYIDACLESGIEPDLDDDDRKLLGAA